MTSTGKFDALTQNRAVRLFVTDTEFLDKTRSFMKPEYFTSEVSRNLTHAVFDFYDAYGVAPNFEQQDGILDGMVKGHIIAADEVEIYVAYFDKLLFDVQVDRVVKNYLIENLREFAKQHIISALIKKISSLEKKGKRKADETYKYVMQCVEEFSVVSARASTIALTDLMKKPHIESDVVTMFNVDNIDNQLGGGFKRGQFYVLLGFTGHGKTWTLIHLGKMAARIGSIVLHIVLELNNKVLAKRYRMSLGGLTLEELALKEKYKYLQEVVRSSMVSMATIELVDEEEKVAHVDSITGLIEDVDKKYGRKPDLILIDSLEDYLPPKGKRFSDNLDAELGTFTYAKNLARMEDICIITSVQAIRRGETLKWLGTRHVGGFIGKVRRATGGVSINCFEEEMKANLYRLYVFKNNEGTTGAKAIVHRDLQRGQCVLGHEIYTEKKGFEYFKKYGPSR